MSNHYYIIIFIYIDQIINPFKNRFPHEHGHGASSVYGRRRRPRDKIYKNDFNIHTTYSAVQIDCYGLRAFRSSSILLYLILIDSLEWSTHRYTIQLVKFHSANIWWSITFVCMHTVYTKCYRTQNLCECENG